MECFLTFYKEAASCRLKQKFFSGRRGRGCCKPPLIRPLVIGPSICEQKIHVIISFPSPSTPPSPSPPPSPSLPPPPHLPPPPLDISTSLAFLVLVIRKKPRCCILDIIVLIQEAKTSFKEIKV